MKYAGLSLILCACCAASGCTASMLGSLDALKSLQLNNQSTLADDDSDDLDDPNELPPEATAQCADDFMALIDDQDSPPQDATADDQPAALVTTDATGSDSIAADSIDTESADDDEEAAEVLEELVEGGRSIARVTAAEEIVPPVVVAEDEFKRGPGEADLNRIKRRLTDVPLDIRPTAGELPSIQSAAAPGDTLTPDRCIGCNECEPIVCSWTPWTICFRPLYFEEIGLERYGASWGVAQPAVSGAHFFGRVVAMPYKMWVRCPRSCVCSNGFSRCDDLPPPDYGDCVWRWDAALFEAGVVAGIVIALP